MADGIEPTEQDIKIAIDGVMSQYSSLDILDFLALTARVRACDIASIRELTNIVNKDVNTD